MPQIEPERCNLQALTNSIVQRDDASRGPVAPQSTAVAAAQPIALVLEAGLAAIKPRPLDASGDLLEPRPTSPISRGTHQR